jgi:hypothetical protein
VYFSHGTAIEIQSAGGVIRPPAFSKNRDKMNQPQKIIFKKLDLIIFLLKTLLRKEHIMSQELDALSAQVQANEDLEASAITLIQGIAEQLAAAKEDPAKIQELADNLKASAANLSAAIVANTPAA